MDRATLNARHQAAVVKWGRAIIDNDGEPTAGLLAELAAIADEHARDQQPPAPAGEAPTPRQRRPRAA